MKLLRKLSFRSQLLAISLILVAIPTAILSFFFADQNAAQVREQYSASGSAMLTQTEQTVDAMIRDAVKIADTPLLSDDIKRAMTTDYGDDYLLFAQDSTLFRSILRLSNRLNGSMRTIVFRNLHGFLFEYNTSAVGHLERIEQNLSEWVPLARERGSLLYFAPLKTGEVDGRPVLPVVKILLDGQTFTEIGVFYGEIDFAPIAEILNSSRSTENALYIYNGSNELIWSTDIISYGYDSDEARADAEMYHELSVFSSSLTDSTETLTGTIHSDSIPLEVNGIVNELTDWHLIQVVDSRGMDKILRSIYVNALHMFLIYLLFETAAAMLFSFAVTRPVRHLCSEIDRLSPAGDHLIDENLCGSNRELRKLVSSFNGMNHRLTESIRHNYEIRLNEQQVRLQMLQFQINHHFLYNTLNIIKSLAEIHHVPEIGTIATSMSDLLRYNLEKFPTALLEEELQQARRYMTIQNIRFPGKYRFDINVPAEFLKLQVPVFMLQPIVENSVEHGFAGMEENCYISISCQIENGSLHFLCADNGAGLSEDALQRLRSSLAEGEPESASDISAGTPADCPAGPLTDSTAGAPADAPQPAPKKRHRSIGLRNVVQRLRSNYGAEFDIEIDSRPGEGTLVDIRIPYSSTAE